MKELDFDELDRAVNSLVGQTNSKASESASTGKPTPQPIASTNNEQKPASQTSQQVVVSTSPKAPSGGVIPERRTGRLDSKRPAKSAGKGFIDIVAPKPAPVTRVSHTSPTIQPVSKKDVIPEPTERVAPINDEPSKKAEEAGETVPKPVPKLKSSEEKWPDPLDFHETAAESSAQSGTSSDSKQSINEKLPSTADSPFIPGAKVEKRPLGAFTPVAAVETEEVEKDEEAKPVEAPGEPQPKVLTAKSTPDNGGNKLTVDESEEESSETPEESSTKQIHESAMMSIPQQYKTATKPVDEASRPVFDTKEYHPPLLESTAHAAHRGGSLWSKLLVWLLVIVVLAVGGYFAFMYFVQNF